MAIVRILTPMAGVDFSRNVGDLHECSDAEAQRLIAVGRAEAVAIESPASKAKAERAVGTVKHETRGGAGRAVKAVRSALVGD